MRKSWNTKSCWSFSYRASVPRCELSWRDGDGPVHQRSGRFYVDVRLGLAAGSTEAQCDRTGERSREVTAPSNVFCHCSPRQSLNPRGCSFRLFATEHVVEAPA